MSFLTIQQTEDLFEYMRSIWGRAFTQKQSDIRVWMDRLRRFNAVEVKQAVDKFADTSEKDFPPNLAQLKRICKTNHKNITLLHPVVTPARISQDIDWVDWATCRAEQLLYLYAWDAQPVFEMPPCEPGHPKLSDIMALVRARQASPEFQALVASIRQRIGNHFADHAGPGGLTDKQLDAGALEIFHSLGAIGFNPMKVFRPMP